MYYNRSKLKKMLAQWPPGTVAVPSHLATFGVYSRLTSAYVKAGWLNALERSLYSRAGDNVEWTAAVAAVQQQVRLPVHVGGRTALELTGRAHFLPLGPRRLVWLFAEEKTKLPTWFKKHDWGVDVRFTATRLFERLDLGLTQLSAGSYEYKLSGPERAMMETLHLVDQGEDFQETQSLMDGLTTLRPALVQRLLQACRSVKVKRLFILLARRSRHAWVRDVELRRVDLGHGTRSVAGGGEWERDLNLAVPSAGRS
jgi:hypothetical protein